MKFTFTSDFENEEIRKKQNDPSYIPSQEEKQKYGFIDIDLDGTLAQHDIQGEFTMDKIGTPVKRMIRKVRKHIRQGENVRIFTARASYRGKEMDAMYENIRQFCEKHFGKVLPITNRKSLWTKEIVDDIAVQVESDTGIRADGKDDD